MSLEEYFLVFSTVFYGFIVTRVVAGFNDIWLNRNVISVNWLHIIYSIAIFLLVVRNYYVESNFVHFKFIEDTHSFFLRMVLPPALFLTTVYQLFPEITQGLDYKEFLWQNRFAIVYLLSDT